MFLLVATGIGPGRPGQAMPGTVVAVGNDIDFDAAAKRQLKRNEMKPIWHGMVSL